MLRADEAWFNDVSVLLRRPREFWPTRDQTPEERLNSIVRLVVYTTAAAAAYGRNARYAAFGVAAVVLVSMAFRGDGTGCGGAGGGGWGKKKGTMMAPPAECGQNPFGNVRVKTTQHTKKACTRSSPDNPFANMLVGDLLTNPGRAPACKYDQHADEIRHNFNRGLVRNVYDIYEKENSQRQFMTMPVTSSAPDTVAFAQFAYGTAGRKTCKEDPSRCTGAFP